jgi:hypothetical protein
LEIDVAQIVDAEPAEAAITEALSLAAEARASLRFPAPPRPTRVYRRPDHDLVVVWDGT